MTTGHANETEYVVLLDDEGRPIGTAPKASVHTADTPLHSALSIFLFDGSDGLLSQRRALTKATWPGVWSNTCCGHPAPGESLQAAAQRRLREELGLEGVELQVALPHFRYRARWNGILENELCPVLIGILPRHTAIRFNTDEVQEIEWIPWQAFAAAGATDGNSEYDHFSPWSLMEARELRDSPALSTLLATAAHNTSARP